MNTSVSRDGARSVTAARIVGVVMLRESLCGTSSDHVPVPVHLLNIGARFFDLFFGAGLLKPKSFGSVRGS
jgi:hypothetical protein